MDGQDKKKTLTPEERARREARRARAKKRKRAKIIRGVVIGVFSLILIVAVVMVGISVFRMFGNKTKEAYIKPAGSTPVVAIDAGHGGEDVGLSGLDTYEKSVDLKIADKLRQMLEAYGYKVVMTRTEDTRISKEDRVAAVNAAKADLVVSVHLNSSDAPSEAGVEVLYQAEDNASATLAEKVMESVLAETGADKVGIKEDGKTSILVATDCPAVVVEAGFVTNDAEMEELKDDKYQNAVAKGIAKGIIRAIDAD